ncbi:Transcriptional regulator, TetR family [Pseudomonas cichorii]|uniref:Transcriptional regulator, TetR family n=1 Tax=Pseudomonas cichorii TaxID=36746 RepID=A0A3M4MAJ6_PSECI|nr:TetR/AcrR family transcriptional regulator [Pseudomonas cichorii]RMQ50264.1 Transcriptional regulator, TetR family [Pseudomonas cichorii]
MAVQRDTTSSTHRTAKGAQRVESLTVVAAELFLERGFEAVAVEDLIARVGGSRRNIYCHFGGKEGLFEAAMMHICAEMAKPLEQMNIQGLDTERVLSAFGLELVRIALSPRTLAVHRLLTTEGKRFPEIAQAMLACSYQKVIELLANWISTQQALPQPRLASHIPSEMLAVQFVSMVSSDLKLRAIVGLIPSDLSADKLDRLVASAVHTFLHGAAGART